MDRMRLFLAFDLPDSVRDEISRAFAPYMKKYPAIKWVPPGNYHITLVFIGEVPAHYVDSINEPLRALATSHKPFKFSLNGWGTFPPGKPYFNVLWVGLNFDRELLDFHRKLMRITGVYESRPYTPHITVARSGRRKLRFEGNPAIRPLKFSAVEIVLFKSILRKEGPLYVPLRKFKLG